VVRSAPMTRAALLGIAILVAGSGAPSEAAAKRLFVPRQHRTIQAAIDKAAANDTVWVAAGVYRGPFRIRTPLTLFAEAGPDSTVLDGGDSVRVVSVEDVRGGSIVGFGIRRGKAIGGGGIQCVRDTAFSVIGCTLYNNWESAIGVWRSSGIAVRECTIRDNKGSGVRFDASGGVVLECQFTGNEGNEGGGLSLRASRLFVPLRHNLFSGNRATGSTGGAVNAADTSEATIADCVFRENTTAVAGGAIASMGGSTLNVSRSYFEKNHGTSGGALHADRSGLNVGYSIFDRNSAAGGGAAIQIAGRRMANVNPILASNTFHRNDVTGDGASLFFMEVSPEVRKNILVVNKDQRAVSGQRTAPLYDCNVIWDPSGGAIGALPSANTLVGDPLFCDPEHGNFKLRDLSPALRATCGPVGALVDKDKAGCATFRLQPAR
jgi:predicted outer membrane repeat protein